MSTPSATATCVACGRDLPEPQLDCPHCHASAAWQDLLGAVDFVQTRFDDWEKKRLVGWRELAAVLAAHRQQREGLLLTARDGKALPSGIGLPPQDRCWSCRGELRGPPSHCLGCGIPVGTSAARELRWWGYACTVIKAHCDAGRLPLAQAHACLSDARARMAVVRNRLEKDRQPVLAVAVDEPPGEAPAATADVGRTADQPREVKQVAKPAAPASPLRAAAARLRAPRRPLWEIVLDPRSIQWLLGLGGALLVIGLVIWLATLGIFKYSWVVAVSLGLGNAAVLGGGWAVTGRTRYQTAGRALTLLACLVMPLNLWYYHASGLITLDGHLWVAALVLCVLYAASAMVLRDPMFVYVLAGGVAMTGLLMLADVQMFWDIAAPSSLLAVLGLICVHVERAFPEGEDPFSRRRFGTAFFWSGHALLGAGLLLLLGAQIVGGWLYEPFFKSIYQQFEHGPPVVVAERWAQLLALALVVAGTYAYIYSDLVVRRVGVYIYLAVFTLLWSEVLVIDLFALAITSEAAIIALALTALAANLIPSATTHWEEAQSRGEGGPGSALSIQPLARAAVPLGLMLSTLPVLLGLVLHLRATYQWLHTAWPLPDGELYQVGWLYVGAMALTAIACRIGAHVYRHSIPGLSATYFFGTATATLVGAAGLLSVLDVKTWDHLAPIMMVIPILYAVASRMYRGHSQERPLMWAAQTATGVIVAAVLAAAVHLTPAHVVEPEAGAPLNLSLALVLAEAAVFYALAAAFRRHGINVYLSTAAASGAVWQLLQYCEVGPEYYTVIFAAAGLVLLIGYRLSLWERAGFAEPAFQCANALMSLGFVAAALLTLSRLGAARTQIHFSLVVLLASLVAIGLVAAWLVRHPGWRRWYVVMAITEAALMFITLHVLSHLTVWQKLEIFSIVIGLALLVVGHVGWYRELDRQDDLVSFSLTIGAMLVAVPLTIAVLVYRGQATPHFSTLNELGMLTAGILLLATGFVLQIRSTTISGAALLTVYLVTLLLYINVLEGVKTAAIWMTIGGAVIFGTGVLLSVYRDRLLTLPDQVKRREGIFRVLSWR